MDIPDGIYRQLKAQAAREGCSVKAILLRGARNEIEKKLRKRGRRVKLPLIHSKAPGTLIIDNAKIAELLFP